MPSIVLELLVGFVIGNKVLSFSRIEPLSGITELGVLTLFFQVGTEVRGGLLGSRPLAVIRTVLLSALTPLLAWWPLQQGFGLSVPTTLLCLALLSATGTGVTLRALAQAGALLTLSTFLGQPLTAGASAGSGPAFLPITTALVLGLGLGLLSFPLSRWWLRQQGPWRAGPLGVPLLFTGSSWLGGIAGLTSLLGAL